MQKGDVVCGAAATETEKAARLTQIKPTAKSFLNRFLMIILTFCAF